MPPLVIEWFEDLQSEGLALNTCRAYAADLGELVEFVDGDLEGATRESLFAYRRSLLVRDLSLATRARRIAAVRSFYEWLRKRCGEQMSIAHDLIAPKRPEKVHRWWTQEQIAQFRAAFTGQDPTTVRDRTMCELGLLGLRISEVIGLDLDSVKDLEHPSRASIRIRRKGNKEQILPLSEDARTALLAWMTMRPDVSTSALFFRMPFHPQERDRLHYASAEKIFKQYARRAHLRLQPRSNFHLLRHSAAQRLADMDVPVQNIQTLLGHRSADTTAIYFRVTDARLRSTVEKLTYDAPDEEKHGEPD